MINDQIDSVIGKDNEVYEATTTANAASETAGDAEGPGQGGSDNRNASVNKDKNFYVTSGTNNLNFDSATKLPGEKEDVDYSQGIGNERIDTISRKLPFDLESTGSGSYADGSKKEVFFGENGEKIVIVTTYEDTDVMKKVFPSNKSAAVTGQTPGGIDVELYYVPFGDVPKLGKGESTDKINAAVFKKNGYKYLIVYSDIIAPEVLYGLVDVV